jgi:hypothetical protein
MGATDREAQLQAVRDHPRPAEAHGEGFEPGLQQPRWDSLGPHSKRQQAGDDDYSAFTTTQKKLIILTAAFASFFSPLSSAIYYPDLNTVAWDLNVTNAQINLTITTYLVSPACPSPFLVNGRHRLCKALRR